MSNTSQKHYVHITSEERARIEAFLHVGLNQADIAKRIKSSGSTI